MTRGGKQLLAFLIGAISVVFGIWGLIEDAVFHQPTRTWLLSVLIIGGTLIAASVLSWRNDKAQAKRDAEAEAIRAKEAEEAEARRAQEKAEREERIRKHIEAEEAELEALQDGDNIERVYRLTHCVSPAMQENLFYCYEGQHVYFSGDDEHDEVVWIVDSTGDRLGRLPKDAAARYLEEGALGVFIKSLEDEDQNTIPYALVFWKKA